ncbi:MAG TPA: hypothetical protein PLH57_00135 [Oligoflexia bacterium]|nr:hypothetical protein [Oligoflexia bacterium]
MKQDFRRRSLKKLWWLPILATANFVGSSAQAYVDPSFHIIRQVARKHSAIDELRTRSRLTFYNRSGEVVRTFTEIVGFDNLSKVGGRIGDAEGVEVSFKSRTHLATDKTRPLLYDLLYVRDSEILFERLQSLGLPLKSETDLYSEKEGILPYKPETFVNLKQFEGQALLVIGEFSDRTPQLWVTKPERQSTSSAAVEGYQVARAVFFTSFDGPSGDTLEFRFRNRKEYRGVESKTFFYPTRIEIIKDGYLWSTIDILELRSGAGASNLDTAHVKAADSNADSRELLEPYLKWIR